MSKTASSTSILSLPSEVFGEILSFLPFFIVWYRLRLLGSPKIWQEIIKPHGYVDLWQNRATWPGMDQQVTLSLNYAFPTLRRLCIRLPGTSLVLSCASMRNLPETLVDIDIECNNAESLFVEPVESFMPSFRSLCFQVTPHSSKWGLCNINMSERFPQLARLRLVGTSHYSPLIMPPDWTPHLISDYWKSNTLWGTSQATSLYWSPGMCYNFVRELPQQTLTSLTCRCILRLAGEFSRMLSLNGNGESPIPFPPSLTEINGKHLNQKTHFSPSLLASLTKVTMDPSTGLMQLCKSLKSIHIDGDMEPSWWNVPIEFPLSLTVLRLDPIIRLNGPPSMRLPPTLTTFKARRLSGLQHVPRHWFPEKLENLSLPLSANLWGQDDLADYLPPNLKSLKIAFTATLNNLQALPRSLLSLKFASSQFAFNGAHIPYLPPNLHTFKIYSAFSINKDGWALFSPSLTKLKTAYVLNGVLSALLHLPALKIAQLNSSFLLETDLPKIPHSIQHLELREVVVTGSSLSRFPSSDCCLTSRKWDQLMKETLPNSVELFWDMRYNFTERDRSPIPNLATLRWLSNQLLYFPAHLTEIDLRDFSIGEGLVLRSIQARQCPIITLRLYQVSLASNLCYPATLTELEASRAFKGLLESQRTDKLEPLTLIHLIAPTVYVAFSVLPLALTHLEIGNVNFPDIDCLPHLHTLVLFADSIETSHFPRNLQSLSCPKAYNVSYFGIASSSPQQLTKLRNLNLPNSHVRLHSIPQCVTHLVVRFIVDIITENNAPIIDALSESIRPEDVNFNARTLWTILVRHWLFDAQSIEFTMASVWTANLKLLHHLPTHAQSIWLNLAGGDLRILQPAPDTLPRLAHTRKYAMRPLQDALARFDRLISLNMIPNVLPHFATKWLPRTLIELQVDGKLFSSSSYQNLPPKLEKLVIWGSSTTIRKSAAIVLPQTLRYLHVPRVRKEAFCHLPRDLCHLHIEQGPLWSSPEVLPPSLTSLTLPHNFTELSSSPWDLLPTTIRTISDTSDYDQIANIFKRIRSAGGIPAIK